LTTLSENYEKKWKVTLLDTPKQQKKDLLEGLYFQRKEEEGPQLLGLWLGTHRPSGKKRSNPIWPNPASNDKKKPIKTEKGEVAPAASQFSSREKKKKGRCSADT